MDNSINNITINIPYKSSLANYVKGFASSFPTINSFKCETIFNTNEKETLELEIDYGIHLINYKYMDNLHEIVIKYEEIGNPVGTYFAAEKLEKIEVSISYSEENKKEKREILEQFLKDAKNHFNKKDDNEIICKILKSGYWATLSRLPKRYTNIATQRS